MQSGSVTAQDGPGPRPIGALPVGHYAWSSTIQKKPGPMKIPVMLRVLMSWLADRLEGGDRLQRPDTEVPGATPLLR